MDELIAGITVTWADGYEETFRVSEFRIGSQLLWMKLTDKKNRHIPLNNVKVVKVWPSDATEDDKVSADTLLEVRWWDGEFGSFYCNGVKIQSGMLYFEVNGMMNQMHIPAEKLRWYSIWDIADKKE